MEIPTQNTFSIIIITVGLIAAPGLYLNIQSRTLQGSTEQALQGYEPKTLSNKNQILSQPQLDSLDEKVVKDHSLEMSNRNILDLLERVNNDNAIFNDFNRLHDNSRFYYRRGSSVGDDSLRSFLKELGFQDFFDLKTVAGGRSLVKSDCEKIRVYISSRNSHNTSLNCDDELTQEKIYSTKQSPFSLNLFQLGDTHFYFSIVSQAQGGYTLVSTLYNRATGEITEIDPDLVGGDAYFEDATLWFIHGPKIHFSYNTISNQRKDYSAQTHNKSRKWWVNNTPYGFIVKSFDTKKTINLGILNFHSSPNHEFVTPQEYFEVNAIGTKFAMVSGIRCTQPDKLTDCAVRILYGDLIDGGIDSSDTYEVPFHSSETACAQSANSAFFWDGDYIVTTSGCPINLELTVFDIDGSEFLYQHGLVRRNYIADILTELL